MESRFEIIHKHQQLCRTNGLMRQEYSRSQLNSSRFLQMRQIRK